MLNETLYQCFLLPCYCGFFTGGSSNMFDFWTWRMVQFLRVPILGLGTFTGPKRLTHSVSRCFLLHIFGWSFPSTSILGHWQFVLVLKGPNWSISCSSAITITIDLWQRCECQDDMFFWNCDLAGNALKINLGLCVYIYIYYIYTYIINIYIYTCKTKLTKFLVNTCFSLF